MILLFVAGMAVAFINTISAAGSLVSLSAFMFAGLSSVEANATNRIPIIFQSFFSANGVRQSNATNGRARKKSRGKAVNHQKCGAGCGVRGVV